VSLSPERPYRGDAASRDRIPLWRLPWRSPKPLPDGTAAVVAAHTACAPVVPGAETAAISRSALQSARRRAGRPAACTSSRSKGLAGQQSWISSPVVQVLESTAWPSGWAARRLVRRCRRSPAAGGCRWARPAFAEAACAPPNRRRTALLHRSPGSRSGGVWRQRRPTGRVRRRRVGGDEQLRRCCATSASHPATVRGLPVPLRQLLADADVEPPSLGGVARRPSCQQLRCGWSRGRTCDSGPTNGVRKSPWERDFRCRHRHRTVRGTCSGPSAADTARRPPGATPSYGRSPS
jgi:hypothetical protein